MLQDSQTAVHYRMMFAAVDPDDQSHAARVVLILWGIKTFR